MPKLKTPSAEPKTGGDLAPGGNARAMLYSYVQRYERLQEEKEALQEDQKEIMGEAKGTGFDTAIMRKVIQRRRHPLSDIQEADDILDTYETAIRAAEKAEKEQSEKDAG